MDVTQDDLDRVPAENLRIDRSEFGRLWATAQAGQDSSACDFFTVGVLDACRWLARATLRAPDGPWFPAQPPTTPGRGVAMPETIDAECQATEIRTARTGTAEDQRLAGVLATLGWAWRGTGRCPEIGEDREGPHQRAPGRAATNSMSCSAAATWSTASHRAS